MRHDVRSILAVLRRTHTPTMLERFSDSDPFMILVSTVLSARTKDTTAIPIARRLFRKYKTPEDFARSSVKRLKKELYGVGFYREKAKRLKALSRALLEKHRGYVPRTLEELLELPGVGRKTANCVLVYAFRKPAIPVDVHVHRVSNRLGLVKTKKPEETEVALMKAVPKRYWIELNELFVRHGQTTCMPVSPFCSRCAIRRYCKRVGVKKSR
ncbi:MAG: endonuclease III [Candidatus Aenigmatarchaeota archaeon]